MLMLYCYVNGYHNGAILIKDDAKSVARAIMYYGIKGDLMITDAMDMPVVTTMGTFLDRWGNSYMVKFTLDELRNELIPMQMKGTVPKKLDFLYEK